MKSLKITVRNATKGCSAGRSYEDACGAAHALDLIGERWAILVIRELMLGPKRFSDLRADLPGISANVLTQRLEGLEAKGILVRKRLPPPASAQVYELTPWGYECEPIIQALGRWAVRSPLHDPGHGLSAVSLLLSFRTMIDPERAAGLTGSVGFDLGSGTFLARIEDGGIVTARSDLAEADVVVKGAPTIVAAAVHGGVPIDVLEKQGALSVAGDRRFLERFVTLFPLPPKTDAASAD